VDLNSISGLINEIVPVYRNEEVCRSHRKLFGMLRTVEYGMYSQFLISLDGHLKYAVVMYGILLLIPLIMSSKIQIFFKLKIINLR
jgi:hypothetical protein